MGRFVCVTCQAISIGEPGPQCADCGTWGSLRIHAAATTSDEIALPARAPASIAQTAPAYVPRPRVAPTPEPDAVEPSVLVSLSNVPRRIVPRYSTGLAPFDAVLGGGLPEAAFVLFSGEPGGGKSTCLMQALASSGLSVVYASGEETVEQISDRAHRLELNVERFRVTEEIELSAIFQHAESVDARIIAIDSIQMMICTGVNGGPGSRTQLLECTHRLMRYAKTTGRSIIAIGHVTNDGTTAGPSMIRHKVDVVLDIENGRGFHGNERLLRGPKNRFGATNVVGRFEMTGLGLVPAADDPDPESEDAAPRARIGALGAELGDSVDGELPDTIANRLLRAAVRLADVADAEADVETIGGGALALAQRFGIAADELHEAAKTFARGIPEKDRRRLGARVERGTEPDGYLTEGSSIS